MSGNTPVGEAYDAESDALAALFGDLLCIATRAGKPPLPILQPDVRAINRAIDTITKLRQERDSALSESSATFKATHRHAEGGFYQVLDTGLKVQVAQVWLRGVRYRNVEGMEFVRDVHTFDARFTPLQEAPDEQQR